MSDTPETAGHGRLARRLQVRLLLFSTLLAVLISAVQIYGSYRRNLADLEANFELIGTSYLESVEENVWVVDLPRLNLLLSGMLRLPGIVYAEVSGDAGTLVRAGKPQNGNRVVERAYPLSYLSRGVEVSIGELRVVAAEDRLWAQLLPTAAMILIGNLAFALITAVAIYLMVDRLVTRHLSWLSRQVGAVSVDDLDDAIALPGKAVQDDRRDELDYLVDAYNRMRQNLRASYDKLRALNVDLEQRVADRTEELESQVVESQRHQRALSASQNQLSAILDAALEAVVVTDKDGLITVFNPAAETLFGYRLEETAGTVVDRLIPDMAAMRSMMQAADAGGAPIGRGREVTARHRDGREFPIEIAVSVAEVGEERLFISIMHDLSERKQAEAQLIDARIAAERANLAKSEFLSRMSHELRTPLNAILGFGQLLRSDPVDRPTDNQAENIEQILKAGQHLLALVNEILDLARIEAGRAELSLEPVELRDLVEEQLVLIRPMAAKEGIRLHPPEPGEAVWVQADRLRLKQCLLNLLSNAIKYNRAEGRVTVRIDTRDDAVAVTVADTGVGFDADQGRRLFEPFHRLLSDPNAVEGSGIGLAITRRLVELMEGRIEVESIPGTGSEFTLLLRAAERSADAAAAPLPVEPGQRAGGRLRVLYVEDNPANVKLVQKALKQRPEVRLDIAVDGTTGLEMALGSPPDLLLLDINLPGIDGFGVIRHLRANDTTAALRIVAVTANAMTTDASKIRRAGFDGILTKPFDLDDLYREIDAVASAA